MVVVRLWCRRGVPGLRTKVGPGVPPYLKCRYSFSRVRAGMPKTTATNIYFIAAFILFYITCADGMPLLLFETFIIPILFEM